ncbi:MAG: permease prefix domain 1-containing protein [Brachybacterium sp.]|uniref:permease prefix domain 1-containing protein n=1 Tax=Brachybacterium sp. TaxID=1891286 RepID=UPI003241C8F5
MSATLTERYISATIRSLPAESQEDVRAELAASIADAVEARTEQGEDPGAAEREVLTGLGDPAVLAAGYADRPLHLLGPRYYLTWRRLLILLLWIVPACAFVGVGLSQALIGADGGTIAGDGHRSVEHYSAADGARWSGRRLFAGTRTGPLAQRYVP